MRILHVTLGLPPLRSGGLTSYVLKLIALQKQDPNIGQIALLYPGRESLLFSHSHIRSRPRKLEGVACYELTNPAPIGLLGGIKEPLRDIDHPEAARAYAGLLRELEPDVVHIHSFIGFGPYLVTLAQQMGIRVIYTAHDYYPICPTVNLMNAQSLRCDEDHGCDDCLACNRHAPSVFERALRDNPAFYPVRRSKRFKSLAAALARRLFSASPSGGGRAEATPEDYALRRERLMAAISACDVTTFASHAVLEVYRRYGFEGQYALFPLIPEGVEKLTPRKGALPGYPVRIAFIGRATIEKGPELLIRALSRLEKKGYNFRLKLLGTGAKVELRDISPSRVTLLPSFTRGELNTLLDDVDLVVVPSVWFETFGFVALEGYLKNIPLVLSDSVGFADYIKPEVTGWLFSSGDAHALREVLAKLLDEPEKLAQASYAIAQSDKERFTAKAHYKRMRQCYRPVTHAGQDA